MIKKNLVKWGEISNKHWKWILSFAFIITLIALFGAIKVKLNFSNTIFFPKDSLQSNQLKSIYNEFSTAFSIFLLVEANNKKETIATIDLISKELKKNEDIKFIIDKKNIDFIYQNFLLLIDDKSFDTNLKLLKNPSFNNLVEVFNENIKKKIEDKSIFKNEDQTVQNLNNLIKILENLMNFLDHKQSINTENLEKNLKNIFIGQNYFLNIDENKGFLLLIPKYSSSNRDYLINGLEKLEQQLSQIKLAKGVTIGLTGPHIRNREGVISGNKNIKYSFFISFISIFFLLIFSLRMKSSPIIIMGTLFIGFTWTIGTIGFLYQTLNVLHGMVLVSLSGIGIDFSVHFMMSYTQERFNHKRIHEESLNKSFSKTGKGIIGGAITSILVFLVFQISRMEFLKDLGIIAAIHIISQVLAMFIVLPCLICLKNKMKQNSSAQSKYSKIYYFKITKFWIQISRYPKRTLGVILLIISLLSFGIPFVKQVDNPLDFYHKNLASIQVQDKLIKYFNLAPEGLVIQSDSIKNTRKLHNALMAVSNVKMVNSIINFLPSTKTQKKRFSEIKKIKKRKVSYFFLKDRSKVTKNLKNLEKTLLKASLFAQTHKKEEVVKLLKKIGINTNSQTSKISQLVKALKKKNTKNKIILTTLNQTVDKFKNQIISEKFITIDNIPENIKYQLVSTDHSKFLLTIFPSKNPWPKKFRKQFIASVHQISQKATGLILLAEEYYKVIGEDSFMIVPIAFLIVFFYVLIILRHFYLSIFAMVPVVLSSVSLLGIMGFFKIHFNFINLVCLPLIIGIGVDYSIHICDRYLKEGKGHLNIVIKNVGEAIFLSALTTAIGFSSIIPSIMKAISSTGIVLTIAVLLCYLYTMAVLPNLIKIGEKKLNWKITPKY